MYVRPPNRLGVHSPILRIFFLIPEFHFSLISVDFVSMPKVHHHSQQYNSIMVVVCRLTGYIAAVPCNSNLSSAEFPALFLDRVVSFMGLRHEIFTRGR